jgi:hypothetical protein
MHTNVTHDNAIAFMIHQCREAAAVSLLVVQFSSRATSLIGRSFKLVRLSAASVSAAYRWRGILMRRGLSVHPAPNNGRPRRDNGAWVLIGPSLAGSNGDCKTPTAQIGDGGE